MQSQTMLLLSLALRLGSLVSAAVVQLPQDTAQAGPTPSNDPLAHFMNTNASSLSSSTAITRTEWNAILSGSLTGPSAKLKYHCDGGKFDRNLDLKSCLSAWESIPRAPGPELTFGPRDSGVRWDVGLPKRYLSSDGTCAIEPRLLPGGPFARAKMADVALASLAIDKCVGGKSSTGGVVWGFGEDQGLSVMVSRFRPELRCYGKLPDDKRVLAACESLADGMSTSSRPVTFGHSGSDRDGLDPDVILPKKMKSAGKYESVPPMDPSVNGRGAVDGLCTMIVSTSDGSGTDSSVWERFWDAAVAINAMCIRKGQSGVWDDIGIKGKLEIQVIGGALGENGASVGNVSTA